MATAICGALSVRWTNLRMACLRDSPQCESKLASYLTAPASTVSEPRRDCVVGVTVLCRLFIEARSGIAALAPGLVEITEKKAAS